MRSHRLDRLAKLTQGVALVGLGLTEAACGGEPRVNTAPRHAPGVNIVDVGDAGTSAMPAPSGSALASETGTGPGMPVHMNSPGTASPVASASASASPSASASASASASPSAAPASSVKPNTPPGNPRQPMRVNTVRPSPKP